MLNPNSRYCDISGIISLFLTMRSHKEKAICFEQLIAKQEHPSISTLNKSLGKHRKDYSVKELLVKALVMFHYDN